MAKSLLIVRDYFPPQVGGISEMMSMVCRLLGPSEISCATGVPLARDLETPSGPIRVHYVPELFREGKIRTLLALSVAWPRLLRRERPKLLQFATCGDAYWGLAVNRVLGIPFIVYAHGNEVLAAASAVWERPRHALCAATRVLANSRFTADLLADSIGVDRARIVPMNPGCDVQRFSVHVSADAAREVVRDLDGRGPFVLTVGNLVERKGHDLVLRALPHLARRWPKITFLIVGDGPFKPSLEELARELDVTRLVRFVGRVDASTLPSFYRLCDVFVMPSRLREAQHDVEGFGMVFLEAGASGKPVIGGRSGGVEDAVVDGYTGLLVDPTSVESLVGAMSSLLEDRDLAMTLGENGRRRVASQFTWDGFARRLRDVIREITAR